MTLEELKQIEDRASAATPGPWSPKHIYSALRHLDKNIDVDSYCWECQAALDKEFSEESADENIEESRCKYPFAKDSSFVAHAREDVPKLIAEVKRLQNLVNACILAARGEVK